MGWGRGRKGVPILFVAVVLRPSSLYSYNAGMERIKFGAAYGPMPGWVCLLDLGLFRVSFVLFQLPFGSCFLFLLKPFCCCCFLFHSSDLRLAFISQQQLRSFNLPYQFGYTNVLEVRAWRAEGWVLYLFWLGVVSLRVTRSY